MRDRPLPIASLAGSTGAWLSNTRSSGVSRRMLLRTGAGLALQAVLPRLAWSATRPLEAPAWPADAAAETACPATFRTSYPPALESIISKLDPTRDVFLSEVYVAELEPLLAGLSDATRRTVTEVTALEVLLGPSLSASSLVPATVTMLRSGQPFTVEARTFAVPQTVSRRSFLEHWQGYLLAFERLTVMDLGIFGVHAVEPQSVITDVVYDLVGTHADGTREQRSGTWTLHWQRELGAAWTIAGWTAHEETASRLHGPGFTEITAEAFDQASLAMRQLNQGIDAWRGALDAACGIDVYGNHGIAAGDVDGSGFDSLYVCQPAGLPNRLLRNCGDGTFEDITEQSGTGLIDGTASALFADFMNGGRQDLLVVRSSAGPLLFHNLGDGRFEPRPEAFKFARQPEGTFTSVSVADYDRDGLLDVYLCVYSYYQGLNQYQFPSPYYDAQNGPPNYLFHNRGDGTFADVTAQSGMNENNNRFSFAAEWCDYDNDGWPDLQVANDFGRKNLYRNNGDGTFTDVAAAVGVEDYGPGMSTCWLDYDNDGRQDLYVANMWLRQGKRITADAQFLPQTAPAIRELYQKHNAGNSMFHNTGKGFADVSLSAGTARGGWSWSCSTWDVDHSCTADLYVTNGFISGAKPTDLQSFFWRQVAQRSAGVPGASSDYEMAWNAINELVRADFSWSGYERNAFFLNNGNGTFTDVAGLLDLNLLDDSRAFALSDFDHDGRLEFALKNRTGPQLRMMRNDLVDLGDSLMLRLRGTKSNRDAIGAIVTVVAGASRQTKFIAAGSGFASQHSKELCFGLGTGNRTVTVEVGWPSGGRSTFEHVPVNGRVAIVEGEKEFAATSFRPRTPKTAAPHVPQLPPNGTVRTWLIAPLFGPDLKLSDQHGIMRTLSKQRGKAALITFVESGCAPDRAQLLALDASRSACAAAGLEVWAVLTGTSQTTDAELVQKLSYPVLTADERTLEAWNIQFRYLFDRRRDMPLPSSFLLDVTGAIICVYQGPADPLSVLKDLKHEVVTPEARFARALPFAGPYFGGAPTRDYFTYGIAFNEYGFPDEAQAAFEQVIAANPNYPAAYFNLGTVLMMKKQYPAARAALEAAVKVNPQDSDAWNNLGMIAGQQSQYDVALAAFRKSALANPNHRAAVENMLQIYRFQAKPAEAQSMLEELIAKSPDNADLRLGLAMSLVGQHELERGRVELERAIALRPNFVDAINNLGSVLLLSGDAAAALAQFKRCQALAPDFDRPVINAALVETRLGHAAEARTLLAGFLAKHPENAAVRGALDKLGPA